MKTMYTEDLSDEICAVIANADKAMAEICAGHDFTAPRTVYGRLKRYPHFKSYMSAKELQADGLPGQILHLADHSLHGKQRKVSYPSDDGAPQTTDRPDKARQRFFTKLRNVQNDNP